MWRGGGSSLFYLLFFSFCRHFKYLVLMKLSLQIAVEELGSIFLFEPLRLFLCPPPPYLSHPLENSSSSQSSPPSPLFQGHRRLFFPVNLLPTSTTNSSSSNQFYTTFPFPGGSSFTPLSLPRSFKMMSPLLLSNNVTLQPKDQNLCFVNSGLQVLYANHEVRELLLAVEPDAFPSTWPVCKELCRLFTSQGRYEVSASDFRR